MPKWRGWTWQKYFRCDRCGRWYPVSYRKWQKGIAVCTYLPCYDLDPRGESYDPRIAYQGPEEDQSVNES
jgi:hypothetical protein